MTDDAMSVEANDDEEELTDGSRTDVAGVDDGTPTGGTGTETVAGTVPGTGTIGAVTRVGTTSPDVTISAAADSPWCCAVASVRPFAPPPPPPESL